MKYIEILKNIQDNIEQLKDIDQFSYDLLLQSFYTNLKILKGIAEGKRIDISENLETFSTLLGVNLEDLVKTAIDKLKRDDILKINTDDMTKEELELIDKVTTSAEVVKNIKEYNFEHFIHNIDLGQLKGTKEETENINTINKLTD